LLDADVFADVKSIREAMERRRAPFYLRRTKEAMVYFPHRERTGLGLPQDLHERIPHTADFRIDGLNSTSTGRSAVRETRERESGGGRR